MGKGMNERQTDFELLQDFIRRGNQHAFAAIVRRHLDLVYATAFRKVESQGAAQEIAQNVFAALARKAWQFASDDSVPAWLYRTTLLESREWLRGELRRRRREQTAAELGTTMNIPDEQSAFRALLPLLDEAMLSLRERDRAALLLRFYENQSLRDLGVSLGISEDAAQKRVANAVTKLAEFFQRRGFRSATATAAVAALEHSASAAPATVAVSIVQTAMQMAPPTMTGLAGILARLASFSKTQVAAACVAIAAVPVGWQWQQHHAANWRAKQIQLQLAAVQNEYSTLQTEIERLRSGSQKLETSIAEINNEETNQAKSANEFDAWKARVRARLMAGDYQWPDDLPFVRIPKSALRQINVYSPIHPPGILDSTARELLGLTPQERGQIEDALSNHFETVNQLIEASAYETNKPTHAFVPKSAIASEILFVPALGDQVKASGDELETNLRNILGDERWPLVEKQLETGGTDTPRRVLNLDAGKESQEIALWIQKNSEKFSVYYGWSGGYSSFSSGGIALDLFLPGAAVPGGMDVWEFLGSRNLPDSLARRAKEWIENQATSRLGKEANP
ncbi:MAG TPA: sigma-70 family RNA polymerase sigma factor [Verrucomicrobiae bacterium]|nr:sigma-70 family RNA polymerase sigma factor [Verrucomicrobiae bacterium]